MTLRLADKWIWDFWLVREGGRHHVFYLQAPRALEQSALRHENASIGHAISGDLRSWQVLPDALYPGPEGSWDDLATWTGSVIDHDGRWYMLYTGISRAEHGLVQRIGLACSDDLIRWEKHPANPVLEADPAWYDLLDHTRWRDQSWRDPWVFRGPSEGWFHVLVTARSKLGAPDAAGVVGHARSRDLVEWEVLPPVTAHGDFAQVEVPQLVRLNGRYEILVSCLAEDHSRERRRRLGRDGQTGTFVFSARRCSAPTHSRTARSRHRTARWERSTRESSSSRSTGAWRFMAFRGDGDRDFLGELTDPLPIREDDDGAHRGHVPDHHDGGRSLIIAPEITSLIDWGSDVDERHRHLSLPELRQVLRRELDDELRRRGVVVERVAAVTEHAAAVEGGTIRRSALCAARRRTASGVPAPARRRLRIRHGRLARQRRQVRAHLSRRRVRGRDR